MAELVSQPPFSGQSFLEICHYLSLNTPLAILDYLRRREEVLSEYEHVDDNPPSSTVVSDIYRANNQLREFCWARLVEHHVNNIHIKEAIQMVQQEVVDWGDWEDDEFLATVPLPEPDFSLWAEIMEMSARAWEFITAESSHLVYRYQENVLLQFLISWAKWIFGHVLLAMLLFGCVVGLVHLTKFLFLWILFRIPVIGPACRFIYNWTYSFSWIYRSIDFFDNSTATIWTACTTRFFSAIDKVAGGLSATGSFSSNTATGFWKTFQPSGPPAVKIVGFQYQPINESIHQVVNISLHLGALGIGSLASSKLIFAGSKNVRESRSIARAQTGLTEHVLLADKYDSIYIDFVGLSKNLSSFEITTESLISQSSITLTMALGRIDQALITTKSSTFGAIQGFDITYIFGAISSLICWANSWHILIFRGPWQHLCAIALVSTPQIECLLPAGHLINDRHCSWIRSKGFKTPFDIHISNRDEAIDKIHAYLFMFFSSVHVKMNRLKNLIGDGLEKTERIGYNFDVVRGILAMNDEEVREGLVRLQRRQTRECWGWDSLVPGRASPKCTLSEKEQDSMEELQRRQALLEDMAKLREDAQVQLTAAEYIVNDYEKAIAGMEEGVFDLSTWKNNSPDVVERDLKALEKMVLSATSLVQRLKDVGKNVLEDMTASWTSNSA